MMNKIYDFDLIYLLKARQKRVIFSILLLFLGFLGLTAIFCAVIENNILLTAIFALLLSAFLIFSVLIYKIKYLGLSELAAFLDNMETGSREEYMGIFKEKTCVEGEDEHFDKYSFVFSDGERELLVHKTHSQELSKGEKYRLECVGSYLYQWESVH